MGKKERRFYDYEGFVAKFKRNKTTDDCYTPPEVYEAVKGWVDREVASLEGARIVRPFYPGGDFEGYAYGADDVVLDNPPFSILARIVGFYMARGIRFFLFAPALTLFNYGKREGVTCVSAHCDVMYENGAVVRTSFLTNMYGTGDCGDGNSPAFVLAGDLYKLVREAQAAVKEDKSKRKIAFPMEVVNAALLGKLAVRGLTWRVERDAVRFVRKMDCGQGLFGGGFLLSERAALERAVLERAALERAALRTTYRYELSERERAIVESLK